MNKLRMFYWCALPQEDGTESDEHEIRFSLKISAKKMDLIRHYLGEEMDEEEIKALNK